ncbi:MAG: NADH:flavin oxidoreductase [Lachnospiraceae bacterium]
MNIFSSELRTEKLTLKNRLVMAPMQSLFATDDGRVTDKVISYYHDRTKNGKIGLVIVEHSFISPEGRACKRQLSISKDEDINGLTGLAETIKQDGSCSCIQLSHAGGSAIFDTTEKQVPIGPSDVKCIRTGVVPQPMTEDDIEAVVKSFAAAASRAVEAGFEAIELHSAHGYLLNQFFSPYSNKRTDEYNGSVGNRLRIHCRVIEAVREVVGENFPILVRLGAKDYHVPGTTLEEGVEAAKILEKAGADILDVSGGMSIWTNPHDDGPGFFRELSIPIRKAVKLPVILTGGIVIGEQAEELLEQGAADLIGVARALLRNINWAAENV